MVTDFYLSTKSHTPTGEDIKRFIRIMLSHLQSGKFCSEYLEHRKNAIIETLRFNYKSFALTAYDKLHIKNAFAELVRGGNNKDRSFPYKAIYKCTYFEANNCSLDL